MNKCLGLALKAKKEILNLVVRFRYPAGRSPTCKMMIVLIMKLDLFLLSFRNKRGPAMGSITATAPGLRQPQARGGRCLTWSRDVYAARNLTRVVRHSFASTGGSGGSGGKKKKEKRKKEKKLRKLLPSFTFPSFSSPTSSETSHHELIQGT